MANEEEDFKNHVYTKCLGLLVSEFPLLLRFWDLYLSFCFPHFKNNVAEVSSTKNTLLIEPLMDFFKYVLDHKLNYFEEWLFILCDS